jgi:peptide/nickel transport system substrate-binding protein
VSKKGVLAIPVAIFLLLSCGRNRYEDKMIFRYNEAEGISSLDPLYAHNRANIWAISMIFNGLFELDSNLKPILCIAKKYELSEDKLTYTFTLRDDILFHDDPCFLSDAERKLKANDVVFSLNRLKKFPASGWVLSEVTDSGIYALNDSTVIIQLINPYVQFINILTMPYCAIVSKKAVEFYKEKTRDHPVGTGPFQFKTWNENEKLILLKNPDYFQFEGNERLPYLDAVNVTFVKDRQIEFLDLVMGELDFMSGVEAAFKDEILTQKGDIQEKYRDKIQLIKQSYLNTEYLGVMVNQQNIWQNQQFRKAVQSAIQKQSIVSFLRSGIGIPAINGFVPPVLYNNKASIPTNRYNPKLLQSLSKDLSPENRKIKLYTSGNYTEIALSVRNDLNKSGLECEIEVLDRASLKNQVANGQLPFFRGSWIADYADPENYLALFYSKNKAPNGPNYTQFENVEFDKYYELCRTELTDSIRETYYKLMDQIIIDEAPVFPLFYDEVTIFHRNSVSGLKTNALNRPDLRRVKKTN